MTRKFLGTGPEMSPGLQMLIHWGLMQIDRAPKITIQLARLRSQEREIEHQLIQHSIRHDPDGAIMISCTLAVHINLRNRQMVCGRASVKSLVPRHDTKILGHWTGDESRASDVDPLGPDANRPGAQDDHPTRSIAFTGARNRAPTHP